MALGRLFVSEGLPTRIGRMETDLPFLSTRDGVRLSRRLGGDVAYHEFVVVGDRVYDALAGSGGMDWHDYQALFYKDVFTDGTLRLTYTEVPPA
jgi:hypothetical protein